MKWKASQGQPAAAPPPPPPPPPQAPAQPIDMTAGQWQPAAAAPVPGPGWAAPTGNTQVSDDEVPDFIKNTTRPIPPQPEVQAPPEPKPEPKKRKAAEPATPGTGAQQAPADLDKILSGLAPKSPN